MKNIRVLLYVLLIIISLPVLAVVLTAPFNGTTKAPQDFSKSKLLLNKPAKISEPFDVKLMTYNVAIAHGFTSNRKERAAAIADLLIELNPDVIGLQELFVKKDREFFLEKMAQGGFPYSAEFPAATLGNGIVIVSKFPIEEFYFHRFKANNPWYKVWEGDWWAGKGIGLARIQLPNGGFMDFYNTHAQAYRGNQESHDVRYQQFVEAANFINQSQMGTVPAFFVGDFNTEQDFPDYLYVKENARLMRLMNIHSDIDHITAVNHPDYLFEVIETREVFGKTMGAHAGQFYSRAPTPIEFWDLYFGDPEETELSDHPGYISHIRVHSTSPETAVDAATNSVESGV